MRGERKRRVKRRGKRKGDGKGKGDRRKEEEGGEERGERGREGRREREKEAKQSSKPQGYIMDVYEASMKQTGLRHKRHREDGMGIYSLWGRLVDRQLR